MANSDWFPILFNGKLNSKFSRRQLSVSISIDDADKPWRFAGWRAQVPRCRRRELTPARRCCCDTAARRRARQRRTTSGRRRRSTDRCRRPPTPHPAGTVMSLLHSSRVQSSPALINHHQVTLIRTLTNASVSKYKRKELKVAHKYAYSLSVSYCNSHHK